MQIESTRIVDDLGTKFSGEQGAVCMFLDKSVVKKENKRNVSREDKKMVE